MDRIWEEVFELKEKAEKVASEKSENDFYLKKYQSIDPLYLRKHLESLSFLSTEKKYLSEVSTIPAYVGNYEIKKKLGEISFEKNHVLLQEGEKKKKASLEQIEWRFEKPVIVEESDIETILAIVEGIQVGAQSGMEGRPQLFFKEFSLKRNLSPHFFERYEIDAKIIQRNISP